MSVHSVGSDYARELATLNYFSERVLSQADPPERAAEQAKPVEPRRSRRPAEDPMVQRLAASHKSVISDFWQFAKADLEHADRQRELVEFLAENQAIIRQMEAVVEATEEFQNQKQALIARGEAHVQKLDEGRAILERDANNRAAMSRRFEEDADKMAHQLATFNKDARNLDDFRANYRADRNNLSDFQANFVEDSASLDDLQAQYGQDSSVLASFQDDFNKDAENLEANTERDRDLLRLLEADTEHKAEAAKILEERAMQALHPEKPLEYAAEETENSEPLREMAQELARLLAEASNQKDEFKALVERSPAEAVRPAEAAWESKEPAEPVTKRTAEPSRSTKRQNPPVTSPLPSDVPPVDATRTTGVARTAGPAADVLQQTVSGPSADSRPPTAAAAGGSRVQESGQFGQIVAGPVSESGQPPSMAEAMAPWITRSADAEAAGTQTARPITDASLPNAQVTLLPGVVPNDPAQPPANPLQQVRPFISLAMPAVPLQSKKDRSLRRVIAALSNGDPRDEISSRSSRQDAQRQRADEEAEDADT